eukprot:6281577-Pyramimonas_sp.AAC.1
MLSLLRAQRLHILNCHQHTETADFLGGFRPSRCAPAWADATPDANTCSETCFNARPEALLQEGARTILTL